MLTTILRTRLNAPSCRRNAALVEGSATDTEPGQRLGATVAGLENINWAGFYLMDGNQLVLGPFQGKPACIYIPVGKGVCGTAVEEGRTLRVDNVHEFPGHIACDAASNSEIVIPIRDGERIVGVLDIDSPLLARFDSEDQEGLEGVVRILERACVWP